MGNQKELRSILAGPLPARPLVCVHFADWCGGWAVQVTGLKVDAIIRGGIRRFTDEVGRLWTSLADFYIRKGLFERARDVFEEGMSSVLTVRDFSLVFDAYSQFEESVLATKMEAQVSRTLPPPGLPPLPSAPSGASARTVFASGLRK
jgi:hypothetical protein